MTTTATRREKVIAVLAVTAAVALVVWIHAAVVVEWRRSESLAASGVAATAVVVDRESLDGPRTTGYRVTYRYVVAGPDNGDSPITVTREVDRATYDALPVGADVAIRYDPDDPQRSDLARNDRLATMLFVVGLIDLALVVAGVRIVRSARAAGAALGAPAL